MGRSLPIYHCTLTAKKSWFFFDKAILAIGCDVDSKDGYGVRTIIENRVIEKSEGILADGAEIPFAEGEIFLAAQRVYIPHAGGFIFPEGGNIKVKFYENNSLRYVSVYLDHGVDPTGEKYAYILLPGASERDVATYDVDDVEIIRNDGEIQSARERSSGLLGIVFRSAGELWGINADHGMIAMAREASGKITALTLCDPTQRRTEISFSVGGKNFRIETDRARGRGYTVEV